MSKKILAILLTAAMALSLSSCGKKTDTPAETPASDASQTETTAPATTEDSKLAAPEGYPHGTISFIVSSSAGSSTDTAARAYVDNLDLGGNIVVENISGGSQTIGTTEAVSRPADGQTLVMMANAGLFSQPLMGDLAYKVEDLRLIANIYPSCLGIVCVRPGSDLTSADDFMDFIQNNDFSYGCPNIGGYAHIAISSALIQLDRIDHATAVAYDGTQNVIQACLNGEIDFAVLDDNFVAPYIENGDLNGLLALYEGPSPLLPEIPGISDYGVTGMESMVGIKFLAVRADTPDEIVQYIKQQANEAVMSESYQKFLSDSGVGTLDRTYSEEELAELTKSAIEQTKTVLEQLGLTK